MENEKLLKETGWGEGGVWLLKVLQVAVTPALSAGLKSERALARYKHFLRLQLLYLLGFLSFG